MVERLTYRRDIDDAVCIKDMRPHNAPMKVQEVAERLASYEDICFDSDGKEICTVEHLTELVKAESEGLLVVLPCKQYTTVYYLLDKRVFVGWYLAQVGETTHLILQDRIEMGICWATDGSWFFTRQEAEAALEVQNG